MILIFVFLVKIAKTNTIAQKAVLMPVNSTNHYAPLSLLLYPSELAINN